VVADEDEARWLSETEIPDEPVSRRHLAAVRDVVFDFQGDGPTLRVPEDDLPVDTVEPLPDPQEQTASLLDDLRSRRGVRQAVELGDEDDDESEAFEGFGPQHAFDFGRLDPVPGAHPTGSDDEAVVYPPPTAVPEPVTTPLASAAEPDDADRPRGRRGRAKVPSWDEIVFGAKPE